ncbi:MAG: AMP-binding protein, partial [Acidobacteria bacterium]|nr:AMP-binding protein [Acidobacteriota bacterium]
MTEPYRREPPDATGTVVRTASPACPASRRRRRRPDRSRTVSNAVTIPQVLLDAVAAHSDLEALVDGDVSMGHAQLLTSVEHAAASLLATGVEHGDRVAIWAPNCWEWVVVALATHHVGGVLVPVNTRYRGTEAAELLERSSARVLFTVTD